MPHVTRPRIARALAMLRGKTVEMPAREHDNFAGVIYSRYDRTFLA